MTSPEVVKKTAEERSFLVKTPTELFSLLDSLKKQGMAKGVGYDVFGTVVTSLYSRQEQNVLLAHSVAEYYEREKGKRLSEEEIGVCYTRKRDAIKNSRNPVIILGEEVTQKQQECSEAEVITAVGRELGIRDIPSLISYVEQEWLQFDLVNTRPVVGMVELLAKSIALFGQEHVGLYSNNSCSSNHILSLLERCGYLGNGLINARNVMVSSEFGLKEYGIGIRKPNPLAFGGFSLRLGLLPSEIAFAGDGGNDVLFATNSGSNGIKLISQANL